MQAFILNIENNQLISFDYLDPVLDWSGRSAKYTAVDAIAATVLPQVWKNTEGVSRNITAYFEGQFTQTRLNLLEALKVPREGKNEPPSCFLKVGLLTPVKCKITDTSVELPLHHFNKRRTPDRAKVSIAYIEVKT